MYVNGVRSFEKDEAFSIIRLIIEAPTFFKEGIHDLVRRYDQYMNIDKTKCIGIDLYVTFGEKYYRCS